MFDLLASFTRIGRSEAEIAHGIRRFNFQAHSKFYNAESNFVQIRADLHQARQVKPDLFD